MQVELVFYYGEEGFWRQVINGKYRKEEEGWRSREVREAYKIGLWNAIRKEGDLLSCKFAFLVGNGKRVRFWREKWFGNEPLCISFPSLFIVASSKEAWIEEVWNHSSKGGCWAPHFTRRINNWEMDTMERFLLILHGRRVSRDKDWRNFVDRV